VVRVGVANGFLHLGAFCHWSTSRTVASSLMACGFAR
jgi:hypothetical protein